MGCSCEAFEEALDPYKQHRLSAEEAGGLHGLSGRHFRRQCARSAAEGIGGLLDIGRVSGRVVHLRANLRGCAGCVARSMRTSR
jgi:hypothetical protein